MLKVNCQGCGASYDVDPRRVPKSGLKMRCPACGASVHVNSPNGPATQPDAAPSPSAGSPEFDLPAPKKPASASSFDVDLPAPKGQATKPVAPDFDFDLPAPKPAAAKPAAKPVAPDFDFDLPAPKPAAAKPAAKPVAPDFDFDLPAPKPAAAKPAAKPVAPDFDFDLPAPKAAAPKPVAPDFDVDLPVPKPAGAKPVAPDFDLPAPKRPASPKPDALELDLPAPKPAAAKPVAPAFEVDLPAPKASTPELELDLPAPKGPKTAPTSGLGGASGATAGSASEVSDLPAVKAPGAGRIAPAFGGSDVTDLPAPKAPHTGFDLDLPAPKAGDTGLDLDLPAPKSRALELDLPTPKSKPPAQKSFARPAPSSAPRAAARPDRALGSMPKDSLAIDPEPFFASESDDPLARLDEVGSESAGATDLPAPGDLPRVLAPQPGPARGTAKLGGKLSKDSLDVPTDFGGLDAMVEISGSHSPQPPARPRAASPSLSEPRFDDLALPTPEPRTGANRAPADSGPSLELELPPPAARKPAPTFDLEGSLDASEFELPTREPKKAPATMALSPEDLEPAEAGTSEVLSLPSLGERGVVPVLADLDAQSARSGRANPTMELDDLLDIAGPASAEANRSSGGQGFGEIDFGLPERPLSSNPLPMPVPVDQTGRAFEAGAFEATLPQAGSEPERKAKKRKKAPGPGKPIPAWVWPLALVVLLGAAGVALGLFTTHGWFGVYLVEQFLPAAGDPTRVAEAIQQAEKQAQNDTYADVRKSLVTLSDARNEAGLNRELLAHSLLHEALYQLRFGDDPQSAQRSVAILARVLERTTDVPGLALARAADAARRGNLAEAKKHLTAAPDHDQPYRGLVAGEIALLEKDASAATEAFERAEKHNGGARASWGLTRALIVQGKLDEAQAASARTLAQSPRHAGALAFEAERALSRGALAEALDLARTAAGQIPIEGKPVRPSRAERARGLALEGRIEERRDRPREAQAAYERALAADPVNLPVLIGSGRMLMRLGRARDALTRFDSAISANPRETPDEFGQIPLVEAGVGAVQALLAQDRFNEAAERCQALLGKFPEQPEVHLWHGHALTGMQRWDDAEAAFQKAVSLAPEDFAGYVGLSQLLFKQDRPEEAARVLSQATGKVKDSAEVRRLLGNSELMRNHLSEAQQQFQAALRFDPKDPAALFGLGVTQRRQGNMDAAEKTLDKLASIDPLFPGLPLERGQLLENRGDYLAAAETYRKALQAHPQDSDLKLRLGAALVTAGQIDEAENLLRDVLKERPTSAEAEHFIGRVLFARNETAQAVQRFERAVNFDAVRGEYHMYLAWAELEMGNLSGALESVTRAIDRDSALGDAHWLLGRVQLRTGAVKDALASFERALKLKPGRVEALAGMGDAYDQLRKLSHAVKSYQEAVKLAPENGFWWYRLGTLHLDRGRRDEARVTLAEAVLRGDRLEEKPHWLPDAHRNYAELLNESGRTSEAMDHYRTFLQIAPAGHPARTEVEKLVRHR